MISPMQIMLMQRTVQILAADKPSHYDVSKPFVTMLLENGSRMELNAMNFFRLATRCLKEAAEAAALVSA